MTISDWVMHRTQSLPGNSGEDIRERVPGSTEDVKMLRT